MKKSTLGSKIKKIYFIGFMGIIVISVLGFAMLSNRMYTKQSFAFCENAVRLNLNLLEKRLLQIQEGQRMMAEDPQMKEIIKYRDTSEPLDYSIELYHQRDVSDKFSVLFRNSEIENAYIINKQGDCLYFYKSPVRSGKIMEQQWFQEVIESASMSTSYISGVHDKSYLINESKEQCISMVMPITVGVEGRPFSSKAYLVCDINLKQILENSSSDIKFALLYADREWYSFEDIKDSDEIKNWIMLEEDTGEAKAEIFEQKNENDLMAVALKTKVFGLKLLGVKELKETGAIQRGMIELVLLIMGAATLLTFIISRMTVRAIVNPMNSLMDKCNQVAQGNYDIEFEEEQIQELEVLSDTIRDMINDVVRLNQRMVEEERKFSEQKLKALQHQINPHFINNVLQSIKAMALSGENKKISDISTYLGKIMAYSVYRPYESVTIKEEFEHVKNYLEVQNIRFDNRILYSIECGEEIEKVKTLKLTLQPLVENAVEHGLKLKEKEFITISVDEEEDMLCILITDNGTGISKEKIQELKQKLCAGEVYEQEKSIGILNVNERIRKKYGEQYGLELISKEGNGTTVIVKIPKEYGGKTKDEGIVSR